MNKSAYFRVLAHFLAETGIKRYARAHFNITVSLHYDVSEILSNFISHSLFRVRLLPLVADAGHHCPKYI